MSFSQGSISGPKEVDLRLFNSVHLTSHPSPAGPLPGGSHVLPILPSLDLLSLSSLHSFLLL